MHGSSAELWFAAADGLFHLGLAAGIPDALTRALEGFRRAEAIDSSYAGGLEHQSMLYVRLGDTTRARDADRRQARIDSTGDNFLRARAITDLSLARPAERRRIARQVIADQAESAPYIATWLASGQGAMEPELTLAEAVFASPAVVRRPSRPAFMTELLRDAYLNAGRVNEMAKAVPFDSGPVAHAREILDALLWDGDSVRAARAAAAIDRWRLTARDTTGTAAMNLPRLARALRAVEHGDTSTARRIREELKQYRAPAASPWDGNTTSLFGKLIEARLAVTARSANAKPLLAELDSLLIDMPNIERRDARIPGNVLIAGMWEAVGEPRRALAATRRRDMQLAYPTYVSTMLRISARAAEAAGEREEAIRSLRAYVAMRAHAEPAFRADLESARHNLARLEGASAAR